MKRTIFTFAILFVLAGQTVCYGDGNELLSKCNNLLEKKTSNYWNAGYCAGLIDGVISASKFYETGLNAPRLFCRPAGVPNSQVVRIIVKYLENHPQELHYDEDILVLSALKEAFPCKK